MDTEQEIRHNALLHICNSAGVYVVFAQMLMHPGRHWRNFLSQFQTDSYDVELKAAHPQQLVQAWAIRLLPGHARLSRYLQIKRDSLIAKLRVIGEAGPNQQRPLIVLSLLRTRPLKR